MPSTEAMVVGEARSSKLEGNFFLMIGTEYVGTFVLRRPKMIGCIPM
jgi:hypothetical protein